MTPDKIIVLLGSLGAIAFVYWFFLDKREVSIKAGGDIKISVSGGYNPAIVQVAKSKPIKLTFTRTDPTDCLEELDIPDLKIKKTLPLNVPVTLSVTFDKPGEFEFHCGMNMFKGKFIVV